MVNYCGNKDIEDSANFMVIYLIFGTQKIANRNYGWA